jgi:hypothetical protein
MWGQDGDGEITRGEFEEGLRELGVFGGFGSEGKCTSSLG